MATIAGEKASADSGAGAAAAWLFTGAVLVSAALVFLVEPLLGRLLLPVLGGSAAVWTTSLAFFQAALLAGYLYAHLLQKRLTLRRQMWLHLGVLVLAAACLPPRAPGWLGEPWTGAPGLWLVLALTVVAGLPFAALSASAPLLQAWCARLKLEPTVGRNVYALYAASNVGSLVGLVAYPTIVEPLFGLHHQALLWTAGFGLFGGLLLAAVLLSSRAQPLANGAARSTMGPAAPAVRTPLRERLVWIALSAAPSSLLLGVTSHISTDVASAPFLWAAPLILYLVTFIIAFGRPRPPGPRFLWAHLALLAAAMMSFADPWLDWPYMLAIHLASFFAVALVCHQALVARRPEAARLTDFYLAVALGGMIGGLFNALVAPLLFPDVWEYPLVLALSVLARPGEGAAAKWVKESDRVWLAVSCLACAPLWIPAIHPPGILRFAMMLFPVAMAVRFHARPRALGLLFATLAIAILAQQAWKFEASYRSFFGVTHVRTVPDKELGPIRMLVHGTTLHGIQPLAAGKACRPTSYYAGPTSIGQVFATEQARKPAMSMAISGLGAGVTATFVRATDRLQYFEIDPEVVRIARNSDWFSLLKCARGPVAIAVGDARLKLRDEPPAAYDLMMMDAFSSDSVPTHLLTAEAIREALGHLKPDGVLLLHVSNRNLELTPVAAASARAAGGAVLAGLYYSSPTRSSFAVTSSQVVLVAKAERTLDRYRGLPGWTSPPTDTRPWTDDYTNVLEPFTRRIAIANGWRPE